MEKLERYQPQAGQEDTVDGAKLPQPKETLDAMVTKDNQQQFTDAEVTEIILDADKMYIKREFELKRNKILEQEQNKQQSDASKSEPQRLRLAKDIYRIAGNYDIP